MIWLSLFRSPQIKWLKNLFRAIFVICMGFIAIFGSNNLDYFVSLVGSVGSSPVSSEDTSVQI